MNNLENLLLKIRTSPNIYIGKKSLEILSAFISGYSVCIYDIKGVYPDYLDGFQEYVECQYNINSSHSWTSIIQRFSNTEEEAFDRFYELLDMFRSQSQGDGLCEE